MDIIQYCTLQNSHKEGNELAHTMWNLRIQFPVSKGQEGFLPRFFIIQYPIMFHEMSNLKHIYPIKYLGVQGLQSVFKDT